MAERDSKSEPRATEVREPQRHYTVGMPPTAVKNRPARSLNSAASGSKASVLISGSPLSSPWSAGDW